MQRKFTLYNDDKSLIKILSNELKITEMTAKILCHRGITSVEEADKFIHPETKQPFYNPFLMKGMDIAIERIIKAINANEKIVVYGDYDVDGMTASSIMIRTLKKLNMSVNSYIPNRQNEGYGLNLIALENIINSGAQLLITVDCGIANANEISAVKNKLDIIITDHHLPQEPINDAIAVIDPHQQDCDYPYKDLCGAGIAFKLCQALQNKIKGNDFQDYIDDIDLAALGTVADIVPLTDENRKIVRIGLKQMEHTKNIGLHTLIECSQIGGKKITSSHLGYKLAPRLNSTGRLATADRGVKLLTTEDESVAKNIADELENENTVRKTKERLMLKEANQKYLKLRQQKGGDMSSIVIADENWHAGIIGLTASKLVEKYYLPTIVIAIQDDIARGSCRSIDSLHMKETLDQFKHYFTQYGGHAAAAGFSMQTKDIDKFREDFDNYVKSKLNDEDFIPQKRVDALISPTEMSLEIVDEIENLEPFGVNNPQPVFACSDVKCINTRIMGNDSSHLSFNVKSDDSENRSIRAVAWNKSSFASLVDNELIDITFTPEQNDFNGNVNVQCQINTLEPSKSNGIFPDREAMINFYKFLRNRSDENDFKPFDICKFNADFKQSSYASYDPKRNSAYTMLCAIQVFEELGLISLNFDDNRYLMPKVTKKFDLNESRFWRINTVQIN